MMSFAAQEQWFEAIKARRAQQCITLIQTAMGVYAYGKHLPLERELYNTSGVPVLDGSLLLNGSWGLSGAIRLIDRGARVLDFEDIQYTLTPDGSLISGLKMSEISEYTARYNNADGHFSALFAVESWLSARFALLFGFRGLSYASFLPVFTGQVREVMLKATTCEVRSLNNS